MILENYTDFGTFKDKDEAMNFRNKYYKYCSCWRGVENDKIRLYIKIPK
ncbi:MAG: hypothetical protein GY793_06390 [Proteobacteria bacterium]|nr:hypothetical protein [Pseudomonadota bacterium]